MERSHYQAKGSYFKNTRHGGGVKKSNALHEMFDWFYRTLGGRKSSKNRGNLRIRCTVLNTVPTRRGTYVKSRRGNERVDVNLPSGWVTMGCSIIKLILIKFHMEII